MNKNFVLTISLLFLLACKKENIQQKPEPVVEPTRKKEPTSFWSTIGAGNLNTNQSAVIKTSDMVYYDLPILRFQGFIEEGDDTCSFHWQDYESNLQNKKTRGHSPYGASFSILETDSLYQSSLVQSSFNIYEVGNNYVPVKLLANVKLDKSNVLIIKNGEYMNLDGEEVNKEDFNEIPHVEVTYPLKTTSNNYIHNTLAPEEMNFPKGEKMGFSGGVSIIAGRKLARENDHFRNTKKYRYEFRYKRADGAEVVATHYVREQVWFCIPSPYDFTSNPNHRYWQDGFDLNENDPEFGKYYRGFFHDSK